MTPEDSSNTGLYVAAFFSEATNKNIAKYISENNIPNPTKSVGFHTTIVYSRVSVPSFEPTHSIDISIKPDSFAVEAWDVAGNKRCLVLRYESTYLNLRFQEAMAAGATYDFDEYKPHISLSYDLPPEFNSDLLPKPTFKIELIGEYSETLEFDDESEDEDDDIFELLK